MLEEEIKKQEEVAGKKSASFSLEAFVVCYSFVSLLPLCSHYFGSSHTSSPTRPINKM